eukprot:scaffold14974_cov195-Amphora_coffeaeformis.AAC.24
MSVTMMKAFRTLFVLALTCACWISSSSALERPTSRAKLVATTILRGGGRPSVPIPDPAPILDLPQDAPMEAKWMPLRWILKTLKVYVLGTITFALLFVVNTIFSILFLFLKPWMRKTVLKRFAGFMMTYSMTPWVEMQFDWGRMLSYVPFLMAADDRLFSLRTHMRTADELVGGPPRLPTDGEFISHVMLRSPLAFYIDNQPRTLEVDLSAMKDIVQYPNTFFQVVKIKVDKKSQEITLFVKTGDSIDAPVLPVTRRQDGDVVFERALQAAMTTLSYFIPGIGHSWVHFLFPDAVAATVHNHLSRSSTLYKLLEPHVRYTSRINWEALGVRGNLVIGGSALVRMAAEATTTAPRGIPASGLVKKFEPWTPFPVTAEEFVRKNSQRTTAYYFSDEFACPPGWFQGPSAELPYIKSLKRFYPIIRKHVASVLTDPDDLKDLLDFIAAVDENSRIDGNSLNLFRFDPIDVIATFIFDAAFIHSTDHYFTNRVFAETRFGLGTLRHTFQTPWYPGNRVPEDIQDPEDRVRYKGFADIFIRFNDSHLISNNMKNLKYRFRQPHLRHADRNFVSEILAEQDKMAAEGDIFCPMEKLSRSICF